MTDDPFCCLCLTPKTWDKLNDAEPYGEDSPSAPVQPVRIGFEPVEEENRE